ncbi:MAG: tetratricopeptide repeat protein [Oligoflexia bacterium]|nr:tetratricopeptide repeat protein [Oligoflexia bacterium]
MTTTTSTNNSSNVPSASVDEALNQTELGGWIAQNKNLFIGLVVAAIVGVVAFGVSNHLTSKKNNEFANLVYDFETTKLDQYNSGNLSAKELVDSWNTLPNDILGFGTHAAVELTIVETLIGKGETDLALGLLEKTAPHIKNNYLTYFYNTHLASIYEDKGETDKAIDLLKKLISSNSKFLEGKLYVDLGRLHLAKGENDLAKSNFQYVIDNVKDAEFKRIATLYLSDLQ